MMETLRDWKQSFPLDVDTAVNEDPKVKAALPRIKEEDDTTNTTTRKCKSNKGVIPAKVLYKMRDALLVATIVLFISP
jgi:hypothetical protein